MFCDDTKVMNYKIKNVIHNDMFESNINKLHNNNKNKYY